MRDDADRQQRLQVLLNERLTGTGVAPGIPRRPDGGPAPLSPAQRRLWVIHGLEPSSPLANRPVALRLTGPLDEDALTESLHALVRRHEILRTVYLAPEGVPEQHVRPAEAPPLERRDLRRHADPVAEAARTAAREAQRPFDLAHRPPFRCMLLRLADDDHVLLLLLHHIVIDGWSEHLLMRDLRAFYDACRSGCPPALPELPLQYADFAAWQCRRLETEALQRQIAHCRQRLDGAPADLALPTDGPRPPAHDGRGGRHVFTVPRALTEQLAALGRRQGATSFMTLLAAFLVLLHRYSGQADLVVGAPVSGRMRREVEDLLGCFVNLLALRADLTGDPPFRELLDRVRGTVLEALAHQEAPFEAVVDALRLERRTDRPPLFQVVFQLRNLPGPDRQEAGGLTLAPFPFDAGLVGETDLRFDLVERPDGLHGTLYYRRDLFEGETIARMAGHYRRLLQGIVAAPGERLSRLPLLTDPERHQLLHVWSGTPTDYPRDRTLHEVFEAQAARTPGRTAVAGEGLRLTYAELNRRANCLAHHLRRQGVGPETLVGVCLERSPELIVALLGILKAGGAYVPLDPAYPAERLAFLLEDAGVQVLLTQTHLSRTLPPHTARIVRLDAAEVLAGGDEAPPALRVDAQHLAYVMYTSGSTGRPKGVQVTHRNVLRLARGTDYVEITPDDVFLQLAPFSFDAATFEIWGALLNGACLAVPPPGRIGLAELTEALRRHEVTILWLTAGLFHLVVEERLESLRGVRQLLAGGDVLSAPHVQRVLDRLPGCIVINGYGPTEGTTFTTCYRMQPGLRLGWTVPIGRPVASTRVYVLDAAGQPVPVGVPGELYAGGDGVARGYHRRPDLTAERFVPDPFGRNPEARLYRTGDLVRWRADGNLEFLGRSDLQVKIRGFRVEPGEVEAVLRGHEAVTDAAVVVHAPRPGDRCLLAYAAAPADLSPEDVRAYLAQRLPDYMVPAEVFLLDALPLTLNGKVDRRALPVPPSPAHAASRASAPAAPPAEIEAQLAAIWAEVLQVDAVGLEDNFFEIGGHSLRAAQVAARASSRLGVDVPLKALFEAPTVAALARYVARMTRRSAPRTASSTAPGRHLPLSPAQRGLWFLERLMPGHPFYHIAYALHIRGPLDARSLERAICEVVRRHGALRTTFAEEDGVPMQVVGPEAAFSLATLPLEEQDGRPARLQDRLREEAAVPFDLQTGPLLRGTLFRLREDDHVLLLVMHHLVSDGWSLDVFFDELAACYRAFSAGSVPDLPALPLQYADYVREEQGRQEAPEIRQELAYWRGHLQGLVPLDLPADRPRPALPSFRGARHVFALPPDLADELQALARAEGATLFMVLLAAFKVLLARYTGRDDVAVGSPIAGRRRPEFEALIGLFVNTLVLRTDLSGRPTFREVLRRTRAVTLQAFAHPNVPLERLVEALKPERSLGRAPLCQVLLTLQHSAPEALSLGAASVEVEPVDLGTSKFDLTLTFRGRGRALHGTIEYSTDLFDPARIEQMGLHLQRLARALAAAPDVPVAELPLWDALEPIPRNAGASEPPAPTARPPQPPDGLSAPPDPLERKLVEIWETILGVAPIATEDNFFQLGGHSLMAVRLFSRIEEAFGIALPLVTLFQAPTVAALAEVLRHRDPAAAWPSLVPIQPEGTRPALFCVHGVGGNVIGYHALARHLGPDQPLYGLQAQGVDGRSRLLTSVEEMAACYIQEIRALQPEGPYHLVGFSFGGAVAYEMARQLHAAGQAVGLVGLFDTATRLPAGGRPGLGHRLLRLHARARLHIEAFRQTPASERRVFVRKNLNRLRRRFNGCLWQLRRKHATDDDLPPTLRNVRESCHLAAKTYVPRPYAGQVVFFQAEESAARAPLWNPIEAWRAVAEHLTVCRVPGAHASMIEEPHVQVLAARLSELLHRASAERPEPRATAP